MATASLSASRRRTLGSSPGGRAGGGEDLGGGAEVGAKVDHGTAGEVVADLVEKLGFGSVPAVDRLVRITDHHERRFGSEPALQESELERVDVLELVDEDMAMSPSLGLGEAGVLGHGGVAERQEVVEVDELPLALGLFVLPVDVGHERQASPGATSCSLGRVGVSIWCDEPGTGPPDLAVDVGDRGAVEVAVLPGEERHSSLEQLGSPPAGVLPVVSQDCQGDRVERAGCDIVAEAEGTGAASEFAGGAPGEGDGENPAGIDGAGGRLPGDAAGEDACLAGPGAGNDAQWCRRGRDRVALLGSEVFEQDVGFGEAFGHDVTLPTRADTLSGNSVTPVGFAHGGDPAS